MQNKIIFTLIFTIIGIVVGGFYLLTRSDIVYNDRVQLSDQSSLELADTIATSTSTTTEGVAQGTEKDDDENKIIEKDFIYVGKKNSGKDVYIDVVSSKQDCFVVVYENTFEPTGELLAVSDFLNTGEHFRIPLQLIREVKNGEVFTVMLHADDGDKFFNLSNDAPVRDDLGGGVYTYLIIEDIIPIEESDDPIVEQETE